MNWTKLPFEDRVLIETIITNSLEYSEVWIDFFCGFGGVTEGIERTKLSGDKIATVIACLNHDENAIGSHKMSHPQCYHITEDIRVAYTDILWYMVREIRRKSNGRIKVKLWFSHECTHYSIAKGGDSRDADSRSLPEELHRYIDDINPDAVWIENVREFLTWGPLIPKRDALGDPVYRDMEKTELWWIPDPEKKGEFYKVWKDSIIVKGFTYDYRFLNCADYGCPTIRKRVFIQFLRKEKIVWAEPTHADKGAGGLIPWIPIKRCLDLTDKGTSIFSYKIKDGEKVRRIKSRKTYARLYNGCIKILEPQFLKEVEEHDKFLSIYYGNGFNKPLEEPCPTLTTKDRASVVTAKRFISKFYNGKTQNQSEDTPSGTLTTVPKLRVITTSQFIDRQYGMSNPGTVNEPANTLTNIPKLNVVTAEPFLMNTNYNNPLTSIDEPSPVITANRKRHYVINAQFNDAGHSIDVPSITLVAKMDKKPNYLVSAEGGGQLPVIYDEDYPEEKDIKRFMHKWLIEDIYMRELRIPEMLKIHTMKPDLPMQGTITEKKKFIGNQVPAQIVTELIQASYYGNHLI